MPQSTATSRFQPSRTYSANDAASITAPNSTPPAVMSSVTRIGASIAAAMPKIASSSRRMRIATPTATAAITAASGAAATDPTS